MNDGGEDEVIGTHVHAASITKFLWGVLSTLVGAWVIASLSFAWSVNGNCVEFRQILAAIKANDEHLAAELDRLRADLDTYPPAGDLAGLRLDVSQLQFNATANTQVLNDLTRNVRDLHPWPVQQRPGAAPPPP